MHPFLEIEIRDRSNYLGKQGIILSAVSLLVFAGIIYPGLSWIGTQISTFGYFFIAVFSWKYGTKRGLIYALAITIVLILLIEIHPQVQAPFFPLGLIASFTLLSFAVLIGMISDLYAKLKMTEEMYRNEHAKSELLLKNILPTTIATRLKGGEVLIADRYKSSTILFCDIVGFTTMAKNMEPHHLVKMLNTIVSSFDHIAETLKLEKIKTIGDAYLVVSGLPEIREDHAYSIAQMALEMIGAIEEFNRRENLDLQLRIGMHSGPVVGGVIGQSKFTFDLWGDTVNLASRLESCGVAGKIQVSSETYELIKDKFNLSYRGKTDLKSYGIVDTYFLDSPRIVKEAG